MSPDREKAGFAAQWIWLPESAGPDQYADFRQRFSLPEEPGRVMLYLAADYRYALWINGQYVPTSSYADWPQYRVWEEIEIGKWVNPGDNVLALTANYPGEDCSVYKAGQPGVWFAVCPERGESVYSGAQTVCRLSQEYESGEKERFSAQLSFSFAYRADGDDGWRSPAYRPGANWRPAVPTAAEKPIGARPVLPLLWGECCPARIQAQGVFWDRAPGMPCGERMRRAALDSRTLGELGAGDGMPPALPDAAGVRLTAEEGDGIWLLVDLGAEESGVPEWELELPEPAAVLVGFGEHTDDLRVRTSVGGRQFAARYEGRAGRQRFVHPFKRIAGRYLQLHIYAPTVTLFYAGIRRTPYPLSPRPPFRCADALHTRIYAVACRTLQLCMHEHYEDCPWREQALYALDSRCQMLYGYYAFGEVRFAQASLRLLAQGQREDGLLELCAPAAVPITIPLFSLSFISAVCEQVEFSGDTAFGRDMLPAAVRILEAFRARRDDTGLVPAFAERQYWNFYEWREGLDGGELWRDADSPLAYEAPLNAMLSVALGQLAGLCERLGEAETATRLRGEKAALNTALEQLWHAEKDVYATRRTAQGLQGAHELTQALMLLSDAVPAKRAERLRERLASGTLVPVSLSMTVYKYDALMQQPELYADRIRRDIERIWGGMLFTGATSFWETETGGWDFDRAGSLCHGWSAVPIWFYCRWVLGERLDGGRDKPVFCGLYDARREEAEQLSNG